MASTSQQTFSLHMDRILSIKQMERDVEQAYLTAEKNTPDVFSPKIFATALFGSCMDTDQSNWKFFLEGEQGQEFRKMIEDRYIHLKGARSSETTTLFQLVQKYEKVRQTYSSMIVKFFDAKNFEGNFIENSVRESCLGREIIADYRDFKRSCGKHWNYRLVLDRQNHVLNFPYCKKASELSFQHFVEDCSDGELNDTISDDEENCLVSEQDIDIKEEQLKAEEEVIAQERALKNAEAKLTEIRQKTSLNEQKNKKKRKMKEFAETLVIFNKKSYPSQVKESFEAIHQFWLKNHNHPNFEGIIAKACGETFCNSPAPSSSQLAGKTLPGSRMPKENEDGTEIPTKKALTSEDLSQVGSITTAADLGISANRPDIDDGTSVDKKENDIEDDDEDLDLLSLL